MKAKKLISSIIMLILIVFTVKGFSNDLLNAYSSENKPAFNERILNDNSDNETDMMLISELEKQHKTALQKQNFEEAKILENQINELLPAVSKYFFPSPDTGIKSVSKKRAESESEGDWLETAGLIQPEGIKYSLYSYRQIDMKYGEDNCLYALINLPSTITYHGSCRVLKSSDFGMTWNNVITILFTNYIGTVSLLVESKQNSNPDSTRIIIFYTTGLHQNEDDMDLAYYSVKVNGTGNQSGIIAYSSSNKFGEICALSDGAFWESPTYFGVVCNVIDNSIGQTSELRFYRTINWGLSWSGTTLNTFNNDRYISADYKEGSPDSVYIAVERKLSATESQIRVLSTPWSPSSNFKTYFLTSALNTKYEKPSLTIKQKGNVDSILLTCTKNNFPVYHFTSNGGNSWFIDATLSTTPGSNKIFTGCSSGRNGNKSFSSCWLSNDGDSLTVRRGVLGNMGASRHKVNTAPCGINAAPVCAVVPAGNLNNTAVIYPGNPSQVYCNQEGLKKLTIKCIPQGFYNSVNNKLNMKDTLKVYLCKMSSPYNVYDSAAAKFDSINFNSVFTFYTLNESSYFIKIKHRNSIEIWSNSYVDFSQVADLSYDFTTDDSFAYGNNEVMIDNTPSRFGMYSGDIDQDGNIDASDIINTYNDVANLASGYVASDITGDRFTDISDLLIVYNNANEGVSVDKP